MFDRRTIFIDLDYFNKSLYDKRWSDDPFPVNWLTLLHKCLRDDVLRIEWCCSPNDRPHIFLILHYAEMVGQNEAVMVKQYVTVSVFGFTKFVNLYRVNGEEISAFNIPHPSFMNCPTILKIEQPPRLIPETVNWKQEGF